MLTVPEEFLLLTLKDEGGYFVDIPVRSRRAGFVGAALMELTLQNRIDCDTAWVWAVDRSMTGDGSIDPILARLSAPDFETQSDSIIERLVNLGDATREASLKRLCAKGILVETESRHLWLLRTRRYPVLDGREPREVKLRLLDVLLGDGLPDPRDVCLMSLAETCSMIGQIVPGPDLALARERISKFSKMELIGQKVKKHLEIFRRAMVMAINSDL